MNSPKILLALALSMLLLSGLLSVLNGSKVKTLRRDVNSSVAQKEAAEQQRAAADRLMRTREAKLAEQSAMAETDGRVAGAETELVKTATEKSDLQSKLQANETQINELQQRIQELTKTPPNPNPGAPSTAELQAQLEDTRKQLEGAEREKSLLSEKFQTSEAVRPPETAVKRGPAFRGSIRGTVLAVNQAYNFVVLNLGNRNGVETNAEMLVLRQGSVIGKIRISSVEPATAIGDVLSSSLARGVQVQPGDTVIYAGSNS